MTYILSPHFFVLHARHTSFVPNKNHTWFKKTNIVGKTLLLYKSKVILLSKGNNDIIKHANEISCQLHRHKLQSWTHFQKWSHFQSNHYHHHHPIFMTTPHNHITFEYYHNLEWEIETRSQNQSFIGENNKTLFYCIMWERQI
jgi:hypothetical protein